jgi:hypothetical protein
MSIEESISKEQDAILKILSGKTLEGALVSLRSVISYLESEVMKTKFNYSCQGKSSLENHPIYKEVE